MKRFICIIISVLISFSASGCQSSKQDVEKIGLVLAIGYDLTPDNKYKITFQVLDASSEPTQAIGAGKGGGKSSREVMVFSCMGDTPYDALNHLTTSYGKNLFLGHTVYLVIGKKLAESGISIASDTILRGQQARPDSILLLTQGTASEILEFQPVSERIPAMSVRNLIKLQSTRGYAPVISRLTFENALASKTAAPVLGLINPDKKLNAGIAFNMAGAGVFKKDKLIGYLNAEESRGMQWINGKVKDGVIAVSDPDGNKLSFFLLDASSTVKPIAENGSITMQINIKAESNLLEMSADLDPMKNPEVMDKLDSLQNQAIEKEVRLALNAAQKKLDADIFDFGGKIHKNNPNVWKGMEHNWDSVFPDVKVKIVVKSIVKSPGMISKPIYK